MNDQLYYDSTATYYTLSTAEALELDENKYIHMATSPVNPLYLDENNYISEVE